MKQRVYEILYRELVENYANSKGRTNTADFWLTISAISFAYGLITCITGLASYIPYGYLYAVSLGGRHINRFCLSCYVCRRSCSWRDDCETLIMIRC